MSDAPVPVRPPEAAFAAEDGWSEIAWQGPRVARSFLGDAHPERLHVRYFRRAADGALVGKAWFGPGAEGPPGHAHGGSIAAILDDAMGTGAWVAGHPVLAARITIEFRAAVPLGTLAGVEAWVERVEGRKVHTRARLRVGERVHAEGEGLFLVIDPARFPRRHAP